MYALKIGKNVMNTACAGTHNNALGRCWLHKVSVGVFHLRASIFVFLAGLDSFYGDLQQVSDESLLFLLVVPCARTAFVRSEDFRTLSPLYTVESTRSGSKSSGLGSNGCLVCAVNGLI